ncbi:DUF1566 domain-containing protein [Vibrio navarrensis]|uniref:Lcl domain-containing protein n=1 Tax=Vibrio navarrensis TaxID=29495 RepID=UPI001869D2EB|nr:DUF1566 domain-containing protein [Vibrio navarrensis]MBE3669754.1 DUF1566 domain-containing protein [Vibrio navarrensis]MBE4590863.1 DUF1566 domain-containing protein [Vibrio navarrensis]
MKFQYSVIAISLALAGCGGGGGGSGSEVPTYQVSGNIAMPGSLLDTSVCIDDNQNFVCDSTELKAKSDNSGKFSLTSTNKNILISTILAQVDNGAGQVVPLAAPGQRLAQGNRINGVTTLLVGLVNDGYTLEQAEQIVQSQLTAAGVSLSGSVLANASENALVTLEQNTLALLAEMTTDQMRSGVSLLAQDLSFDGKSLTAALLTPPERAALVANIVSEVQRRIGHNDTGATLYFTDGDQEVAEAQESYPGQDAEYGLDNSDQQTLTGNGFKFVKLDAKGQTLADDATEWACTLDERSGLVWENKSGDASSVQFKDRTFVFESQTFKPYSDDLQVVGCVEAKDNLCSTQQYVAHMNQQSLCGITQWRLPTYLEFYDIIDFGETAKDENDHVYGLDVRYFPQQTQGSPDLNTGAIWLNNISFNNYSPYQTLGVVQFPVVATKGADRGYVSFVEIYSDKVSPDSGTSFQFPIRLVAAKEQ